jgi:hypothetical protein
MKKGTCNLSLRSWEASRQKGQEFLRGNHIPTFFSKRAGPEKVLKCQYYTPVIYLIMLLYLYRNDRLNFSLGAVNNVIFMEQKVCCLCAVLITYFLLAENWLGLIK